MTTQAFKRKLTAILSADVKGYSRLMGEDEEGTIRTLNAYKEVITGFIQNHRGRVVGTAGDSVLAEFASVVDAVRCAVEIQEELKDRNKELPEDRRMEFRIGVNLGDVVEEGDTIYGDGVNIAARLESLAEAGGICISGMVYENIKNKLAFGYEYVGEQAVKNIKEPVRIYRVLMEPGVTKAGKGLRGKVKGKKAFALGIFAAFVVVAAVVALWQFYLRPAPPPHEAASKEKMAYPLPDKPSIAVLPFVNMSKDADDDYFGDGLSEDLITALSKTSKLFVIARHSSFGYKGKALQVKQVSEELGVRYVLEGSVRKAGDRVRITAQLIDALTGHHLWVERYDRDLKDIFAVQEDITKKIITAVQVQLTEGERARIYARGTNNLDAYLKAMEATWIRAQTTKENVMKAQQLAQEAIALDPNYAYAYTALGWTHSSTVWLGISKSPQESLKRAIELFQKAISLDDSLAIAHVGLGYMLTMTRDYDRAIAQGEKAMTLEPSSADVLQWYAAILAFAGQLQEAIPMFRESLRLNPNPGNAFYRHFSLALRHSGQYDEAIALLKKAIEREPNDLIAYLSLTSTFGMAGRMEEARAAAKEVLRINPRFSVERYEKTVPFKDKAAKDQLIDGLRKAGLK